MAFVPLDLTDLAAGKPVDEDLMEQIKDNFDALNGQIGAAAVTSIISNGSFEIDSDSDGIPDSWGFTAYPGGSGDLVTSPDAHGQQAFSITHPGGAGNGGGYLESDYMECSEYVEESLRGVLWDTANGKNEIEIRFFTDAKVYISSTILYTSVATPATPLEWTQGYKPPVGSRFLKVRLIGGKNDTDSAGVTYFDFISKRIGVTRNDLENYRAGSIVLHASDAQATESATSMTKMRETRINRDGEMRISFILRRGVINEAVYGQIYVNGSPYGTERSTASDTGVTFSEDLSGLKAEDLVQIYGRTTSGGSSAVGVLEFRLANDFHIIGAIIL